MPRHSGKMLTDFPKLIEQWDYEKNSEFDINKLRAGSGKKVNWKCSKGSDHKWKAVVYSRTGGRGCPYCSGNKVSTTNSLASLHPELVKQIDWAKEPDLNPEKIIAGTHKKIHWKCPKGPDHKWIASPDNRINKGRNCPYCANQLPSITNNLESIEPELAKMWHYEKNKGLTPKDIIAGSNKKFWWKCPKGENHIWHQTPNVIAINSKRHKGNGCPKCGWKQTADAKAKPKTGSSLADSFPELVKDWHPKNNYSPYDYKVKSNKKVFWKCHKNSEHEWETTISNRTEGNDCPYCSILPRSKSEIRLAFELKSFFEIDIDDHKIKIGDKLLDLDIKIPSLNLVIEFDGSFWHKEKMDKDIIKTKKLQSAGWQVIRIREEPLETITTNDITVKQYCPAKEVMDSLLPKIKQVCNIDIEGLNEYIENEKPVNEKSATQYISQLLKDKNQTTLM